MNKVWHTLLGILSIVTILGAGGLMSAQVLRVSQATVSHADWAALTTRVSTLETNLSPAAPNETAVSDTADHLIPINTADLDLLDELPGIGPARAADIIEARATGPFRDLADFRARVPSIPKSIFEDISTKISFE